MATPTIKIIGLGNIFRGDDAVGNAVARQLCSYQSPSTSILERNPAGLNLLYEMDGTDKLILIDAMFSRSPEGTVRRFTVPQDLHEIGQLAWGTSASSTHDLGMAAALTLAHTLGELPPHVVIYGIELGTVRQGVEFSPAIAAAISTVAHRILTEELEISTCTSFNSCVKW